MAIPRRRGSTAPLQGMRKVVRPCAVVSSVTKGGERLIAPATAPELVRKAFNRRRNERPGATADDQPEEVGRRRWRRIRGREQAMDPRLGRARGTGGRVLNQPPRVVVLAGPASGGRAPAGAHYASPRRRHPVATTFSARACFRRPSNALGARRPVIVHDTQLNSTSIARRGRPVGYDLVGVRPSNGTPSAKSKSSRPPNRRGGRECYTLRRPPGSIAGSLDAIAAPPTPPTGTPPIRNRSGGARTGQGRGGSP